MIRAACPGPIPVPSVVPATIVPTTSSRTGFCGPKAPAVSTERSAYPSIDELTNGGTGSVATTEALATQPSVSSMGRVREASTVQASSTNSLASSSGIIGRCPRSRGRTRSSRCLRPMSPASRSARCA